MEADFFHRGTLGWLRARVSAAIVLMAFLVTAIIVGLIASPAAQASLWGVVLNDMFFVVVAMVLAYCTAGLIVGARRSADRTLRRSILLLGLALSTLVLSIVLTFPLATGTFPYVIVNQGTGVVGIYLIYRSVMSFSLIGKIEKEAYLMASTALTSSNLHRSRQRRRIKDSGA